MKVVLGTQSTVGIFITLEHNPFEKSHPEKWKQQIKEIFHFEMKNSFLLEIINLRKVHSKNGNTFQSV